MVVLYGRAGRLTAKNGGFRPGQYANGAGFPLGCFRDAGASRRRRQSHLDAPYYISSLILYIKYNKARLNDFNAYG
jgi:hypothetical protein